MDSSQRRKGGIVVGEEFRNVEGEVGARMEAWKELVHGGSVVGGPAVPPNQMSPRTHGPRTSCPARHLVLGLDVPSQDSLSPLHILQRSFNVEVLVPPWRDGAHLYNYYAAFSRYPTGSSKNHRRII